MEVEPWTAALTQAKRTTDAALVSKAVNFAAAAHAGQVRRDGTPFVSHPLETAKTLAGWGADATTVAAGVLHDVVEVRSWLD